jgi:hypothetical protein
MNPKPTTIADLIGLEPEQEAAVDEPGRDRTCPDTPAARSPRR